MTYPDEDDFERAREEDAADPNGLIDVGAEELAADRAAMAHLPGTARRRAMAFLLSVMKRDEFDPRDLDFMTAGMLADWAWRQAGFADVDPNPARGFLLVDVEDAADAIVSRPRMLPLLQRVLDQATWETFVSAVPRGHKPGSFYRPDPR